MSSHDLCNVEVQDEGKAEAEAYKEFACFCKDTQVISTGCIASRIVLTGLVRGGSLDVFGRSKFKRRASERVGR